MWRDPTQYGVDDPVGPSPGDPASAAVLDHHRARLPLGPKVAVVTATVGGPHLDECVRSVQAQTYANVEHWVIVDGPEFEAAAHAVTDAYARRMPLVVVTLPRNTGADGWNGHRVYGAVGHLVDAPLIAFLDEDNAVDPDHVESLVHALAAGARRTGAQWAYSLRRIVDRDGAFVCNDACESLGGICHTCVGERDRLVDTSCYLMPRELAVDVSPCWNVRFRQPGRVECDRALATALLERCGQGACTRRHSVAYRVGSSARSVQASFFRENDQGYDFENKRDVYVFHFGATQARQYFARRLAWLRGSCDDGRQDELEEWQMTLWRGLEPTCNVLNGFANLDHIPHGAVCLVAMCHPQQLPLDFFRRRTDLLRVCYTLESPNMRHQAQWDTAFLTSHFDKVLTYWADLLRLLPGTATYCPHNTHHLSIPSSAAAAGAAAEAAAGAAGAGVGAAAVSAARTARARAAAVAVKAAAVAATVVATATERTQQPDCLAGPVGALCFVSARCGGACAAGRAAADRTRHRAAGAAIWPPPPFARGSRGKKHLPRWHARPAAQNPRAASERAWGSGCARSAAWPHNPARSCSPAPRAVAIRRAGFRNRR